MNRLQSADAAIEVSIRDLVAFPDPPREARLDYSLHRSLQAKLRRKYKTFESEVRLSTLINTSRGPVQVAGRLDGLYRAAKGYVLFEIKSVDGVGMSLDAPALQAAQRQLELYADLFGRFTSSRVASAVLLLVDPSGKERQLALPRPLPDSPLLRRLETYFDSKTKSCTPGWTAKIEHFIAHDLETDRPLQSAAWRELLSKQSESNFLLALSPGAGKTRIALRWAFLEASRRSCSVIWITAKARGRETVLAEIDRYRACGIELRAVWKTTRERHCRLCTAQMECPTARDTAKNLFYGETEKSHSVCEYELARAAESGSDIIITDLNYILSPSSIFGRRAVYVIDEAQHWTSRARERTEASLSLTDLHKQAAAWTPATRRRFNGILRPHAIDESVSHQTWQEFLSMQGSSRWLGEDSFQAALATIEGHRHWYMRFGSHLEVMQAGLNNAFGVMALSGSICGSDRIRNHLFPLHDKFTTIEPDLCLRRTVHFVPHLDFSYPIALDELQRARDAIHSLYDVLGGTLWVVGQSRETNLILQDMLRTTGLTALDAQDLGGDWQSLLSVRPAVCFASAGSSATESVNPPPDLFSAAVVLSAGFRAPSTLDRLREAWSKHHMISLSHDEGMSDEHNESIIEAAARIVQAVGRMTRTPDSNKPIFLLDRRLTAPEFLRLWPREWKTQTGEFSIVPTLDDTLELAAITT